MVLTPLAHLGTGGYLWLLPRVRDFTIDEVDNAWRQR